MDKVELEIEQDFEQKVFINNIETIEVEGELKIEINELPPIEIELQVEKVRNYIDEYYKKKIPNQQNA